MASPASLDSIAANLRPVREQITIAAPPDRIWPLLTEVESVVGYIPGATLTGKTPEGKYQATIRVRFGPTVAVFRGEADVVYDHEAMRCTINGRGIDQRGASRALAAGIVTLTPNGPNETVLTIDGGFSVSGPLETFANAGGVHVARVLLSEFASNISQVVAAAPAASDAVATDAAGEAAAPVSTPRPAPVKAKEIGAGTLIWKVIANWFGQLFSSKKRNV
ncbi:MAG: SRPBCC family protein [Rhizobiaceae bacterium]